MLEGIVDKQLQLKTSMQATAQRIYLSIGSIIYI